MAFFNPYWAANKLDDIDDETEYRPSVILIGIDSLSRSNAIRSLPKTLQYLRDDLEAFDFMGLRKVGLNAFPNLIPLLTGRPHTDFPNYMQGKDFADSIPLIWKEDCTARTATAFIEDCPGISIFNYLKPGFYKQPSEYYFRSFEVARRKFKPMMFTSLGEDSGDCYGKKNLFVLMKEYFKGFLKVYRDKRKFALFWATHVGHDYVNHVRLIDESLLEMLQWMKREINMENIMLIFLGDHGFRMGGLALTHIGRKENNNPALIIHVPKQLKINVENILLQNTARLVSHYDIYQTMYDILSYKHIPPPQYMDVQDTLVRRNILNPIPIERTCSDAGVPAEYCTCYEDISVGTNSSICLELGRHLVHHINNNILHNNSQCAGLHLYNISDVSLEYSDKHVKRQADQGRKSSWNNQTKSEAAEENLYNDGRYRMVIFTIPGEASFEGLLDYSSATNGNRIQVIGLPSRLNVYGNQSHCSETVIKSFCYCKDLLNDH
ncbi:hypothetical protein DPMN_103564 [Dreissena polymorpha]|uniref:Uncharacterized protein n=2 Tax=Dreissena polymorpha TaxID=45954 RepID=A0A9D4HAA4_DREPO|nr:hypothetical protein DPMN_103564 [Dreissena polymorpha]